jgi:rod shape-determining protein MreC
MRIYDRFDNRINTKKDVSPKYLFLTLSIICVVLVFVSYFAADRIAFVKKYTGMVVTPVQNGVDKIGLWMDSKVKNLQEIEELNAENEALKEEISSYKEDINLYQSELQELAELRNLYNLDDEYPELNKTAAHVFATDSSSWFSSFYIDKGTEDGIFVGANVMCGEGLAGIVTECFDNYSKVRAIIDDESNVSTRIMPANALCTLQGSLNNYENGYLEVVNIDKDAAVSVGDKIVTSHVSERFHPGIVVGYISEITLDSNNLTMTAKITPAVDFENISVVLVVTDELQGVTEAE